MPFAVAKAWAMRTVFLIYIDQSAQRGFRSGVVATLTCRPLNSFLLRSSSWDGASLPPSPVVETLFACWMNAVQISAFAFLLSWSYLMPRWMRLWTASSKTVTLFVVRIITPWKYSSCRRKTETRVLCCRWCWVRASRKTSASSRRRMAFQRATRSRISARQTSSFSESRPRSPAHTCGERVSRRCGLERSHDVLMGKTNSVERSSLVF